MPCTIRTIKLATAKATRVLTECSFGSPRRDELPVWPPEECSDDDQDHVHHHERQEKRVGQQTLAGKPAAYSGYLAIDIRNKQEQQHCCAGDADASPKS